MPALITLRFCFFLIFVFQFSDAAIFGRTNTLLGSNNIYAQKVPVIVGTPDEMAALKRIYKVPLHVIHPVKGSPEFSTTFEDDEPAAPDGAPNLDSLLSLLRNPFIATVIYENPQLLVQMAQTLVGPKPPSVPVMGVDNAELQSLFQIVRQHPSLVRSIIRADPAFVTSLVERVMSPSSSTTTTTSPPMTTTTVDNATTM